MLNEMKVMNFWFISCVAGRLGAIPVERPCDSSVKGKGTIEIGTESALESISGQQKSALGLTIIGHATEFDRQVKIGDSLVFGDNAICDVSRTVISIDGPGRLTVALSQADTELNKQLLAMTGRVFPEYLIMAKIDQAVVYSQVHRVLRQGGSVGIFPEGGSHDRTTMLPFKPGFAIMALGSFQCCAMPTDEQSKKSMYDAKLCNRLNFSFSDEQKPLLAQKTDDLDCLWIVPVGLCYFNPHKFRSRPMIEFGEPLLLERTSPLVQSYISPDSTPNQKHSAVQAVMQDLRQRLSTLTLNADSLEDLMTVQTVRRLLLSATANSKQFKHYRNSFFQLELTRTLLRLLKEDKKSEKQSDNQVNTEETECNHCSIAVQEKTSEFDSIEGKKEQSPLEPKSPSDSNECTVHHAHSVDLTKFSKQVHLYNALLSACGLRDHQVQQHHFREHITRSHGWLERCLSLLWLLLHSIAFVPGYLLNLPVLLLIHACCRRLGIEARRSNPMKVEGLDVLASWKILYGLVLFPLYHITLALLLYKAKLFSSHWHVLASLYNQSLPIGLLMILAILMVLSVGSIKTSEYQYNHWSRFKAQLFFLFAPKALSSKLVRMRMHLLHQVVQLAQQYGPSCGHLRMLSRDVLLPSNYTQRMEDTKTAAMTSESSISPAQSKPYESNTLSTEKLSYAYESNDSFTCSMTSSSLSLETNSSLSIISMDSERSIFQESLQKTTTISATSSAQSKSEKLNRAVKAQWKQQWQEHADPVDDIFFF